MRQYVRVSGVFCGLIAVAQFVRAALQVSLEVGGIVIPIWPSVVAFLIFGGLATWAWRTAKAIA